MNEWDFVRLISAGFKLFFVKDNQVFQIVKDSPKTVAVVKSKDKNFKDQIFSTSGWAHAAVLARQVYDDKVIFLNPKEGGYDYLNNIPQQKED